MREPFPMHRLFIWLAILSALSLFIFLGAIRVVFEKLGVSGHMVSVLMFCSIFGSLINLPLFRIHRTGQGNLPVQAKTLTEGLMPLSNTIVIGINVGGGLIPLMFSLYLIFQQELFSPQTLLAVCLVSVISYLFSFSIPGIGVGMPIFIAPISAALIAVFINAQQAPALAYVSGTLGVLIGADFLRLKAIRRMPVKAASIGGAGTFDGVFMTGIIAVLLT